MDERDEPTPPRSAAEGVRIIRADEAKAALDAGQVAGRRPDDAPRFGDVPPQPTGPRSPLRFPLPDSVDPASAVARPPVRPGQRRAGGRLGGVGQPRDPMAPPPPPRVVRLLPSTPTANPPATPTAAPIGVPAAPSPPPTPPTLSPSLPPIADRADVPPSPPVTSVPEPRAKEAGAHFRASGGPSVRPFVNPPGAEGLDETQAISAIDANELFAPRPPEPVSTPALDGIGTTVRSEVTDAEPPPPPLAAPDLALPDLALPDLALPKEGITLQAGSGPELPHWTDPPTGEVPFVRAERDPIEGEELSAWQALGSRGLRWRDDASDWDDMEDVGQLADDETRLGALDTTRTDHSDMFSFDEQFERLEDERSGQHMAVAPEVEQVAAPAPRHQPQPRRGTPAPRRPAARNGGSGEGGPIRGGRDISSAVVVGFGLLIAVLVAYAVGAAALAVLATVIVTACALELYNLIQQRGFRPATLVGLCATVAVMAATYWRGEQAILLILALVFATSMLWYMLGVVDARPVVNIGLTMMAFVWVGVFGSYASLILRAPHGKALLLLPVLVTAATDVTAFFTGSTIGSRPLAAATSPGKTWEGVIAGGVGAIVVAVIVSKLFLSSTWSIKHALLLGLVVAVVDPIGDLCESMVKRDLDLKDSGTALPGHGGLLDRFDALLFVLPATYYLAQYLKLF